MELSEVPAADTAVPPAVLAVAGGAPTTPLWRNELGGLTFRIDRPDPLVAKWSPPGLPLDDEAERLRWLAGRHPAPEVVSCERLGDEWLLVTRALPGESAVSARWAPHPVTAARAVATGLRRLHALDPADCPFDWSVPARIGGARAEGRTVPAALADAPPIDRHVVCHGDACAPNTMLDAAGGFLATVDVGTLGVADRWADLAIGSWSLDWNYGSGYDEAFWAAYGIEPDADRIAYYRALWDAT